MSPVSEYQRRLVELLESEKDSEKIIEELKSITGLKDYADNLRPEMIEIASLLLKKWGVKRNENS